MIDAETVFKACRKRGLVFSYDPTAIARIAFNPLGVDSTAKEARARWHAQPQFRESFLRQCRNDARLIGARLAAWRAHGGFLP